MCKDGRITIVPTPDWLWSARCIPGNGIAIDSCIAEALINGWARGVRTLGSCCGHSKERPNVVLTNDVDQIDLARDVFPDWTLLQWQLIDVSRDKL